MMAGRAEVEQIPVDLRTWSAMMLLEVLKQSGATPG